MIVTKLPIDTGISGWNAVLPPAPAARVLERNITADWLVVGAGFAGLAAARRLSQLKPGDKIVLLDACRIGQGPAGRNSGFMIDLPHNLASDDYSGTSHNDLNEIQLNRTAIEFAGSAAAEAGLDSQVFNRCGKVNAAATDKGMKHLAHYNNHLKALNEKSAMLGPLEMTELTGTDYFQGGLFTPGTAMIQPAAYVRGLAKHLSQKIDVFENTPITRLAQSGNAYRASTVKGQILTPKIILAVNGHVQSFGFFPQHLMHIFTYASSTRELTQSEVSTLGGASQWNIIPSDPMGTTVRRVSGKLFGGDRIIIRNYFSYEPSMQIDRHRLRHISAIHRSSFRARFPGLKHVEMEYCWGGRLCLSRNNVPAFGEVAPNIFSAACQNGLGTTKGTLSGILAAELATGTKSNLLDFYLKQAPPKKLFPDPIMSMGVNAWLKLKQWQAGKEL